MTPDSDVIIRLHSIMTSESGVIICLHSIKTSADLLKRKRFTHGTLCSKSISNGICVVLTRDQWHLVTTRDPKKLPL